MLPNRELQFLIYNTPQENVKVDVVVKDETLFLTQKSMAALFDVGVPAVNKHLANVFETGELMAAAQVANQFAALEGRAPMFPDGSVAKEAVSIEITRLWNTQLNMEGHTFARLKRTGAFPGCAGTV